MLTEPRMGGLQGFFTDNFPLLIKYVQVFHELLKETMPFLAEHMQQMPDLLWINKWFSTCFLYSFPLGLCIRIMDNILADGTKFFFKVSLAILKLIENDLIELDFTEMNEYFKKFKDEDGVGYNLLPNFELIITEAHKFK